MGLMEWDPCLYVHLYFFMESFSWLMKGVVTDGYLEKWKIGQKGREKKKY